MRWIAAALLSIVAQSSATLPPPYPRSGVTKILDNDRVQVWNIAWPKGEPTALHRHLYDLVGPYYERGDRVITSPEGVKRSVSTPAFDIAFQRAGLTHIEEGVSDAPLRAVFVEMKVAGPYSPGAVESGPPPIAAGLATQKLDNDRTTVWEFVSPPAAAPHTHSRDTVVITIDARNPRATWVPRGTAHDRDGDGTGSRVYVIELK
jgi:hypothetical protein